MENCGEHSVDGGRKEVYERVAELDELFKTILPLLRDYELQAAFPDSTKVVEFVGPEELKKLIGNNLPDEGQSTDVIVDIIKRTLLYSVRTSHPRFFDKLYAGSDPIGQLAELVTAVLNTNVHTYAVSPVFAVMEQQLMKFMSGIVGFDEATAEGILVPGGSYANLSAMVIARHHYFPHVRLKGWKPEDRPVVFSSRQSHYSLRRASMMLGFGMEGTRPICCDKSGRMDPKKLEIAIQEAKANGETPFMVVTTAGTTVMGGFDYFEEIREICTKYNLWMHVDAAWGGLAFVSEKHRHLVKGAEKADSVAWDSHKGMGVTIYASAILVNNHMGLLRASNHSSAEYLFHDHAGSQYDLGDMTLQCGRRADSLKIWLSWVRYGRKGIANRLDVAMSHAEYITQKIKKDNRFVLVADPLYTNVCFWYLPTHLRNYNNLENDVFPHMNDVTSRIYNGMQTRGTMLVNFNPLPDHKLPAFFRLVIVQPLVRTEDMDFVLEEIDRIGKHFYDN